MNIKLVGVGKCGSRICYDFFAQMRGLPLSYELRRPNRDSVLANVRERILDVIRFNQAVIEFQKQWQLMTGAELLKDRADYSIVDADLENNEVAAQVELLTHDGKRAIFPARPHRLAGQTGGCQYHIISENLCDQWPVTQIPANVIDQGEAEIFAVAFSLGGGTGGGASPQLAAKSKFRDIQQRARQIVHYLGVGILPSSDERYFPDARPGAMDDKEKFNAGRFFTGLLGGRNRNQQEPFFNGLWLMGNDLLRFLLRNANAGQEKVLSDQYLSLVNGYLSLALCTLCNHSSSGNTSDTDIDPRELNSLLDGSHFISAFAFAKPDSTADASMNATFLQGLFASALSNARMVDDQLQGLSVPIEQEKLDPLQELLSQPARSMEQLDKLLGEYDASKGPVQFTSAQRIVTLYGQSEGALSAFRQQEAQRIAKILFPNSEHVFASYRHSGQSEYLLMLIVRPFLPLMVNAVFDYVTKSWLEDKDFKLGQAIRAAEFPRAAVEAALYSSDENAHLPRRFLGDATIEAIKGFGEIAPFTREHVVTALKELHRSFHHRRQESERWDGGSPERPTEKAPEPRTPRPPRDGKNATSATDEP